MIIPMPVLRRLNVMPIFISKVDKAVAVDVVMVVMVVKAMVVDNQLLVVVLILTPALHGLTLYTQQ
jgi:hypothetical protein